MAVLMIDVDRFKAYNDTYGHPRRRRVPEGDRRLPAPHDEPPQDVLARFGGEKFVVLLPDTDETKALALAEQFRQTLLARAIAHAGSEYGVVTASIGIAANPAGSSRCGPRNWCSRPIRVSTRRSATGATRQCSGTRKGPAGRRDRRCDDGGGLARISPAKKRPGAKPRTDLPRPVSTTTASTSGSQLSETNYEVGCNATSGKFSAIYGVVSSAIYLFRSA